MVEESGRRVPGSIWRSVAISAALHLMAIVAVGSLPTKRPLPPPSEQSITVEILTEPQASVSAASSFPKGKHTPAVSSTPVDEAHKEIGAKPVAPVETAREQDGMVRAKELFSAKILADPRSKGALVALRQLATDDRIIQLCNVEVMEQIHRWTSGDIRCSNS